MKLTWRGRGLVFAVALVTASGFAFGERGLNAIVVPGIVALLASVYQIYDLKRPTIRRELPERAHRGETVRVRVSLDSDASLPAYVREAVGEGLSAQGNEWATTLDRETLSYDLTLDRRGERSVGPLTIEARDVFGFVSRTYRYRSGDVVLASGGVQDTGSDTILVWPRIYPLTGSARLAIRGLYGTIGDERQEFDYLRSYRRGDPLKDIHWKSSAKHPEEGFVVKEFTADEDSDTVVVGVEAGPNTVDAMADAAASVAHDILDAEVDLVLYSPTTRLEPDDEGDHRENVMDHLARVEPGSLPEGAREEVDVVIRGTDDAVRIELEGRHYSFRDLVGTDADAPVPTEPAGATANP